MTAAIHRHLTRMLAVLGIVIGLTAALALSGVHNASAAISPAVTVTNTLGSAAPANPAYTFTTGAQTGRIDRDRIAATCAAPKASPALFTGVGARQFDAYTFTQGPVGGCISVTYTTPGGPTNLHVVAYTSAGFVPAASTTNYLADYGGSNSPITFSFSVPANTAFTVVVHEVNPAGGTGQQYTLTVGSTPATQAFDLKTQVLTSGAGANLPAKLATYLSSADSYLTSGTPTMKAAGCNQLKQFKSAVTVAMRQDANVLAQGPGWIATADAIRAAVPCVAPN